MLLFSLLAVMILLSTAQGQSVKSIDRQLGDLTFPLYLSHSYVSLAFRSLTLCDNVAILAAAFAESLEVAYASCSLIDPAVNRLRDFVRQRALDRDATCFGSLNGCGTESTMIPTVQFGA